MARAPEGLRSGRRPRRLGHLTPSCNSVLEPLTVAMASEVADRVSHHFTRIAVERISLSPADLNQFAPERMLEAARLLADAEVDAIVWNGTSGAWKGLEADEEICRSITRELGVPTSTSTLAQVEAMGAYGLYSYGLAVPYTDDVARRMIDVFASTGLECVGLANLGVGGGAQMAEVTAEAVRQLIRDADDPSAHCIVFSCTGVAAAHLVEEMECELGKPIIDSIAVTLWKGMKLLGLDRRLTSWGALLAGNLGEPRVVASDGDESPLSRLSRPRN